MSDYVGNFAETPVKNRTRWGPVILIVAAITLYFSVSRPAPDLSGWGNDPNAAMREASQSNRKVLLAFYMPGCVPCEIMDRTVLPDPQVKKALSAFVPVRLDATVHGETALRYEVYGTPTYAVVDSAGRLLARREGTQTVSEFVQFLTRAASLPSPSMPPSG